MQAMCKQHVKLLSLRCFLYITIKLRYQTTVTTQFQHMSAENKTSHYDNYTALIGYCKIEISKYVHYAVVIKVTEKYLQLRSLHCFISLLTYHGSLTTLH